MTTATFIQGFNVGTDISWTLTDAAGDVFSAAQLGHLTEFSSQAEDNMVKVTPITNGGIPIYQCLWNGHRGTMRFARVGPTFMNMFLDLQNLYHVGGVISQLSLLGKVRNRDGSTDSYLYQGVQLESPQYGGFMAVKEVDMRCNFRASIITATSASSSVLAGLIGASNLA